VSINGSGRCVIGFSETAKEKLIRILEAQGTSFIIGEWDSNSRDSLGREPIRRQQCRTGVELESGKAVLKLVEFLQTR
jgi:hypothetical protein